MLLFFFAPGKARSLALKVFARWYERRVARLSGLETVTELDLNQKVPFVQVCGGWVAERKYRH